MGKFCSYYNPENWIFLSAHSYADSTIVYKMIVGYEFDDYSEGEVEEYIDKEVYEKLLSKEYYSIKVGRKHLQVRDKNNKLIKYNRFAYIGLK